MAVTTPITSGMTNYVSVLEQIRQLVNSVESGKQNYDAELAALASLTSAANKLPYFTGSGAASTTDFTAPARSLLDDLTTADMLNTLGTGAMITANTTLTVGTAASGATYLDINSALASIASKRIQAGVTVTVSIISNLSSHSAVNINHADSGQITIKGNTTVTTTAITSVSAGSGVAGAWYVDLTVADASGIIAGDYVFVSGVTASTKLGDALAGHWEVGSVAGSVVRVKNTYRGAAWPIFTFTSATLSKPLIRVAFSAVGITFSAPSRGITIQNVSLLGADAGSGITLNNGTTVTLSGLVGVSRFIIGLYDGFNNSAGIYANDSVHITSNSTGVSLSGCALSLLSAVISGNSLHGCALSRIASGRLDSSIIHGNGNIGVSVTQSATVNASQTSVAGNVSVDYYAASMGYINANSPAYASSIYSPAINTQGNEFGYIDQ